MASERTCQPFFCAASFNAGPPRSVYSPALARSEMVMMPTTISLECWIVGVLECCFFSITPLLHSHGVHGLFRLFEQPHVADDHVFIDSFAHVVNREQCDRDAGESLHFDACLRNSLGGTRYLCVIFRSNNIDLDITERQCVTQRNQTRSLLRGLNASDSSGCEDVALCNLITRNHIERLALEPNLSGGNSSSLTHRLGRYIDHLC